MKKFLFLGSLMLCLLLVIPGTASALYTSTLAFDGFFSYSADFNSVEEPTAAAELSDSLYCDYSGSLNGWINYTLEHNVPNPSVVSDWTLSGYLNVHGLFINKELQDDVYLPFEVPLGTFAYDGSGLDFGHYVLGEILSIAPEVLDVLVEWDFSGDHEAGTLTIYDLADGSPLPCLLGPCLTQASGVFDGELSVTAAPVPEPGTIVLMGLGLIGLAGMGRKKLFKK